ncbi:MAG: FIST signal transduction protein [Thermoanaerobaculia bacterium]
MATGIRSLASLYSDSAAAARDLIGQLEGFEPAALVFFAGHSHDGAAISRSLKERFASAQVIGCTTAGEFSDRGTHHGCVTALALDASKIAGCSARLVRYGRTREDAIVNAVQEMSADLAIPSIRNADPERYVGIVLFDGLSEHEEEANEVLGDLAPMLSFVGGSAGDGLEFTKTKVFCNGEETEFGAALMLIESAVAFSIGKSCSYAPMEKTFRITSADPINRVVHELNGRPVLEVYAEAVGTTPDKLDSSVFMGNPVGLMIDDEAWIRSPQRALPDGGLKFYCRIAEGMEVRLMKSTDIVEDARRAIVRAGKELGAPVSGGLAFNGVLRRLEMDAKDLHREFLHVFDGLQVSGFHTYGESWLGHINQTLTAVWFA